MEAATWLTAIFGRVEKDRFLPCDFIPILIKMTTWYKSTKGRENQVPQLWSPTQMVPPLFSVMLSSHLPEYTQPVFSLPSLLSLRFSFLGDGHPLLSHWQPLDFLLLTSALPWDLHYLPTPKPTSVLHLWEDARVDSLVKVCVPFSLNELSQIEKDSVPILITFVPLLRNSSMLPNLTSPSSMMFILSPTVIFPKDLRQVWEQARVHTEKIHHLMPPAQLGMRPWVELQQPRGILDRNKFITCLLTGPCKAALKVVNYEKTQEVIQDKQENPYQFPGSLTNPFYNTPTNEFRDPRWKTSPCDLLLPEFPY